MADGMLGSSAQAAAEASAYPSRRAAREAERRRHVVDEPAASAPELGAVLSADELDAPAGPAFRTRREMREAERVARAAGDQAAELSDAVEGAKAIATRRGRRVVEQGADAEVEQVNDTDRIQPLEGELVEIPSAFLRESQGDGVGSAPVVALPQSRREARESADRKGQRGGKVLRGAIGATAVGFAATVAVATILPAAAPGAAAAAANLLSSSDQVGDAPVEGAQTLTVSASVSNDQVARTDAYRVTTMGSGTAQILSAGMTYPGANAYVNDISSAVQWPFAVTVPISDYFGARSAPCAGCSSDHKGVDFAPGLGTPISAIAGGVVKYTQNVDDGGLGIHVIVTHTINGQQFDSVYGHMIPNSITVKPGDVVHVGDQLGQVGSTGASTGPHLHLEIHTATGEKIDPFAFLRQYNVPSTVVTMPAQGVAA